MHVYNLVPLASNKVALRLLSGRAAGGFASPAADHYEAPISLDELMNLRAPHMWLADTEGDSMSGLGIYPGTKLVIDKSLEARHGHIVVAYLDNQPVVKQLQKSRGGYVLASACKGYAPIHTGEFEQIDLFGVVLWTINYHGI